MVDLRIEPTIHMEYTLAKKIYLALTHDARVADLGSLRYTPYVDGWIDKRELNPEQFRRQGLPLGRLDNVVDMLIIRQGETTDQERIATFGECETRFGAASPEDVSGPAGAARDLFVGFNPSRRPILWRLLLAQFAIYKALLASIENKRPPLTILQEPWTSLSDKECEALGVPSSDGPPKPGSAFSDAAKYLQVYVLPDVRRVSSDRPA